MTSSVIFGVAGTQLSEEEIAFFREVNPYGFILFARNCKSPEQLKVLTNSLNELSGRDALPILVDQEGGRVARLKPPHWGAYPPAAAFASLFSGSPKDAEDAVYLNARLIAQELSDMGFTVDCAPLADLPVEGAHDIIGDRAFGRSPEQVIALARAMANGLMDGGIVPVLKHVPGHGRAGADSHLELPVVNTSLDELRSSDFVPFKALADLPMAMTAHVLYPAIDAERMATVSPVAIKLIREEIGFDNLLMSDDLSMKAMQGGYDQRARDVLAAGCDVVLHCNGKMKEMRAVAEGLQPLEGVSLTRAERAMQCAGKADSFDVADARARRDALLKMVA